MSDLMNEFGFEISVYSGKEGTNSYEMRHADGDKSVPTDREVKLWDALLAARMELDRATQIIRSCGVPETRAKSVPKGIEVFVTRLQKEIGCLKTEERAARADRQRLVEALNGLAHRPGECWCDMAIGNPMLHSHTEACKSARAALESVEPETITEIDNRRGHVEVTYPVETKEE